MSWIFPGHQDGKAHEVEIHLMCGKCDAQGLNLSWNLFKVQLFCKKNPALKGRKATYSVKHNL